MKLFIAMHKVVELELKSKIYEPLLVGSYNKNIENITRDDNGENISNKNENYCELTGVYWIWKNCDEDIVGLCHYRRFLSKKFFSANSIYYINENDISSDFKKGYNVILPKKHFYKKTIYESLNIAPNKKDMLVVENSIKKICPEYYESYNKFMNSYSTYLCNVIVTKKEIFDSYCEWLFKILDDVEKNMDKETYINDSYRKRMFGFLSERLLNIWLIKNNDELKIKEYNLINTEEKLNKKIKYYIKQIILRIIHR